MKLSPSTGRKKARLEIIPLIDIMFFLVATFMMVSLSLIKNEGIDVQLPIARSGESIPRQESATLTITAAGDLYFNKKPVSLEALGQHIQEYRLQTPEGIILINADKAATMSRSLEILDCLRLLGVSKIAFQTQPAESA